jgi:transposase-like protein
MPSRRWSLKEPPPRRDGEGREEDIEVLRTEVLEGLKEMKRRAGELTEAIESARNELQSEIARAHRVLKLLRLEQESETEAPASYPEDLIAYFDMKRAGDVELETAPAPPGGETSSMPGLDPAWLLLDDGDEEIFIPAAQEPLIDRRKSRAAPLGVAAVKALASRTSDPLAQVSADRKSQIVAMSRSGLPIAEIARRMKLSRGEVAVALARVR